MGYRNHCLVLYYSLSSRFKYFLLALSQVGQLVKTSFVTYIPVFYQLSLTYLSNVIFNGLFFGAKRN